MPRVLRRAPSQNSKRRTWADVPLVKKGLIVVAIPLLALALSSALFFQSLNNYAQVSGLERDSVELRARIQAVETLLVDAETGVRGYLLTGRASFLEPHSKAITELPFAQERLQQLSAGDPRLMQGTATVTRLTRDRLVILDETLEATPAGRSISASSERLMVEGKRLADRLRAELATMTAVVDRRLERRRSRLRTERAHATIAVVGSLLLGVGAGVVTVVLGIGAVARRSRHLVENAKLLSEGRELKPLPAEADEIGQLGRRIDDSARLLSARSNELREARAFLERLIEASPVIIVRADIASDPATIDYVSPNVERLLGYEPAELEGTSGAWAACVHEDDRPRLEEMTRRALSERRPLIEDEHRLLDSYGKVRWFDHLARFDYEASGSPGTMTVYAIDVTERKLAEGAAAAAQEEAERSNLAKSQFLSRMSHELRTPLHAILGFAQLLEMDELTEKQEESVRQVLRGGRHLLGLINEVLDLSRIESGGIGLSVESVRLDSAVAEAMDLIRPQAAEREITLAQPAASGHYGAADRQKLQQVLLNLLSNAVKYNRDGGRVWVEVASSRERVRISVRDTGMGIPEEQWSELFRPFSRLGAEGSGIEGTGLGLSLCKGLVEAMNGSMGVESQPGVGSTFWLDLRPAEEAAALEEAAAPRPSSNGSSGAHKVVLYIEDNLPNVLLVQSILAQRPNIELLVATEGERGVQMARDRDPHLVLLDLNLPNMHGLEVLRRLRSNPATNAIPVVVLSGDASAAQSLSLLSEGASSYLTKPIDVKEFLECVDEELR